MTLATRPPLPIGMIFAVVLVASLEWFASRPRNDLAEFIPASWVDALRSARTDALSADVLFLGDSQVKGGLIPGVFEAARQLRAYNLAIIGGQPVAALALLRQAIDSGARPRALVVGFYPGLLAADSRINVRQLPELLGPIGCFDVIRASGDFAFIGPLLTRSFLPSLRRRDEIRAVVLALTTATPGAARTKALAYRRNWRLNAGAQALAVNPAFRDDPVSPAGEPGAAANRAGALWRAKDEHIVQLRKLLALAESRGIAVFWLLPTNSPRLQSFRRDNGLDEPYLRVVMNLQREFPGLTVLDSSPLLTNSSVFSDACHLYRNGAIALSLAVAEALREALADTMATEKPRSNWVVLAEQESGMQVASDLPEDINRSARVIDLQSQKKLWR